MLVIHMSNDISRLGIPTSSPEQRGRPRGKYFESVGELTNIYVVNRGTSIKQQSDYRGRAFQS